MDVLAAALASTPLADDRDVAALAALCATHRVVALTGAGCSTESGIPDYRGPTAAPRRSPIFYLPFVRDAAVRRRYWARATLGWPRFAAARPNPAHRALAALEADGRVLGVITQNVDGLHAAAGSSAVTELHGSLHRVRCLGCGELSARDALQARLLALNPSFDRAVAPLAPDGDAELADEQVAEFRPADCERCGGVLKPHVVFFGENVPPTVTQEAWGRFETADALWVIGSSLEIYSGYRFVRRARERGIPVAVTNLGPVRSPRPDERHVHARAGDVLPRVALKVGVRTPTN